jgi:orotate phosphoribosyltransferase
MSTLRLSDDKKAIARQTARMMLEINAIHFNAEHPFVFTSGWASPVYVDCRKLISYPRLRSALMDLAAHTIATEIGYESIDVITGGETAGIPFAAWIADKLMLPMQYVRKKAKGFGRNAQIEDGRSKVMFADALRKAGAQVDHCFVVFFYDIFPKSHDLMKELGIELHYLATWWDILDAAKESGHFDAHTLNEVESFLNDPASWSSAHGGISEFAPASKG